MVIMKLPFPWKPYNHTDAMNLYLVTVRTCVPTLMLIGEDVTKMLNLAFFVIAENERKMGYHGNIRYNNTNTTRFIPNRSHLLFIYNVPNFECRSSFL